MRKRGWGRNTEMASLRTTEKKITARINNDLVKQKYSRDHIISNERMCKTNMAETILHHCLGLDHPGILF